MDELNNWNNVDMPERDYKCLECAYYDYRVEICVSKLTACPWHLGRNNNNKSKQTAGFAKGEPSETRNAPAR